MKVRVSDTSPSQPAVNNWPGPGNFGTRNQAKFKAWMRFKEQLGEQSEMAVNFAQWKQAVSMITLRALQLFRFTRELKRGNLKHAAGLLGMPEPPKGAKHRHAKNISSQWLEYSYGWKPLVQDIGNAIDILQGEPKFGRARGRASSPMELVHIPPPFLWTTGTKQMFKARVQYDAFVRVNNPNLALANQLGFVNPATVAWELVPFSFVVDWFAPVGEFLSGWTDLIGFEVTDASTSIQEQCIYDTYWSGYPWTSRIFTTSFDRKLVIDDYEWFIPPFKRFSVARAANAVSVLIQQLPRK